MNRRLVALLVALAISLQAPGLAYASAAATKTMPAACAGQVLGHLATDNSCCPEGMLPGVCCGGGLAFAGMPSALIILPTVPSHLLPPTSDSVAFATERPSPLLRPPIT